MKILFLSHYFPPEVNAPATRTFEHCVRWARAGHDVTVVTCAPNCPDGAVYEGCRSRLRRQVEYVEGVRVVRVWTYVAAGWHGWLAQPCDCTAGQASSGTRASTLYSSVGQ